MKILFVCLFLIGLGYTKNVPKHDINKDWWETATFYQIYPRSFKDNSGDGNGDLKGIITKLDYLKEIGIGGAWLSPIFSSPLADMGYDISDFYNVDKIYGTMEDIRELFKLAKEKNIKIILDFVPNHSSDECEWFQKSIKREGNYTDYYVWHDGIKVGEERKPPNNWNSVFYGPAWTWNEERKQYYLHQFDKKQPDLNYRNQLVVDEMKNVLRFWLKEGAAGFRVDAIPHLFEVEDFSNEPLSGYTNDTNSYGYTLHHYTTHLDETYDMVYQWRTVLDEFQKEHEGDTRIMMTEAYANTTDTMRYYQSADGTKQGSHMPFNFVLIEELNEHSTASDFKKVIDERLNAIPKNKVTNWVIGNHDKPRVGSRYGTEKIDALMMLVMTLPGIAVTYQGEEIGMVDNRDGITWEETKDPQACNLGKEHYKDASRDPARTPFQWDDTKHAGFSGGDVDPWLPIHPNYKELNLKKQQGEDRSTFKLYKDLIKLRESHTIIDGDFKSKVIADDVLTYVRSLDGHDTYVVAINFGDKDRVLNVTELVDKFDNRVKVVVAGAKSSLKAGEFAETHEVHLKKYDAFVLESFATRLSVSMALFVGVILRFIFA